MQTPSLKVKKNYAMEDENNFVKEPASKEPCRASKQAQKPLVFGSRTFSSTGSPASAANFLLFLHFSSLYKKAKKSYCLTWSKHKSYIQIKLHGFKICPRTKQYVDSI